MPDKYSSSESMVSGVGGSARAAAEAILLLDRVAGCEEDPGASAAFLFLVWEEMVSTGWRCLETSSNTGSQAREAMVRKWTAG